MCRQLYIATIFLFFWELKVLVFGVGFETLRWCRLAVYSNGR